MQQIVISGLGGQGVLFVTKLLAETALDLDYSVMISETHGMAQRGGNVISHLKVANEEKGRRVSLFSSPLIRPGRGDILLALHQDGLAAHGHYLKSDGMIFCNTSNPERAREIDAGGIAGNLGSPVSANLVLLAFAVGSGNLYCRPEHVEKVLKRLGGKREAVNLQAYRAGLEAAKVS